MSSDEGSTSEQIINDHEFADTEANDNEDASENGDENTEQPIEEAEEIATGSGEDQAAEDANKKTVKPKRVVKNPQPKLNEQTIQGPRGISALPAYFERVKFKGKGHEEQDLNVIMKTYEYWSHRLFPKFPFDASIERLEKLGHKKATRTHIKRIRHDLLVDDREIITEQDENEGIRQDDDINVEGFIDIDTNNQFEQLQLDRPSTNVPKTVQPMVQSNDDVDQPTDEQLERMRQNRERALRIRQEKLAEKLRQQNLQSEMNELNDHPDFD